MDILSQLFGGVARVKVMRLFLFNENKYYTTVDIASKTRLTKTTIRKELRVLEKTGMLKRKEASKKKTKGDKKTKSKRSSKQETEYILNPRFVYADALKRLLSFDDTVARKDIAEKLKKAGKLKFVVMAGIFLGRASDRVDLLVVGDNIRKKDIERTLQMIESDIGREIAYAYFDTEDFYYRLSVKDRLVRDILDYPHERVIEKIQISF
ncbi:MAG: hypothetical protein U5L75_02510 [Candidatus Campbellbacteria bacterium]|nr:hypothetical protein [Candidatus Campbellbacteria bacterium]